MGTTLAIVDDEPLWLDLLRVALTTGQLHVAAAFTDAHTALANWPHVEVALIDVELGAKQPHGFTLARELRARHPGLAIVFLTSVADPWMIDHAAAAAMAGTSYLLKRGVGDLMSLQNAVLAAARGEVSVDPEILDVMRGNGPVPGLTPVQCRMLRLLALGRSNAQISAELGVAQKTVEANITRISRVLGVPEHENVRVGCVTRYLAAATSAKAPLLASPQNT